MKLKLVGTVGIALLIVSLLAAGCGGGGKSGPGSDSNPNQIVINAKYTANASAATVTERYANSYRISGATLATATVPKSTAKLLAYDPGITATEEPDGLTLTNTTTTGNLFATIGYTSAAGCFNFTAAAAGKISIDFQVDIDGKGGGGTYIRAFNGSSTEESRMVATQVYVPNRTIISDSIQNMYLTEARDNVYFRITLPKGGVMKIRAVYLYMETTATGFAGMADRITGGAGAAEACTYTVTNAAGLKTALANAASDNGASMIKVGGEITFADWCAANGYTRDDSSSRLITINSNMSNLTVVGQGSAGVFNGVGFKVQGTNIIIQNITVHEVKGQDGIQINNATYVQVDHCTLYNYTTPLLSDVSEEIKDTYDELISAKNSAQYIILSWNHLYGSYKTILVGSNDEEDARPDRKMIIHHNYFENCGSRLPLYRGGFGHIYNNYYSNCTTGSGINCRTGSRLKIEKNYFENCKNPIGFWYDTTYTSGYWDLNNNIYFGCTGDQPTASTATVRFESGYRYTLDDAASVPAIVKAGAGAGKI